MGLNEAMDTYKSMMKHIFLWLVSLCHFYLNSKIGKPYERKTIVMYSYHVSRYLIAEKRSNTRKRQTRMRRRQPTSKTWLDQTIRHRRPIRHGMVDNSGVVDVISTVVCAVMVGHVCHTALSFIKLPDGTD